MSWADRAACKDDPAPECWFAAAADHDDRARALHVCFSCPVRAECLAEALALEAEPVGVRGGMSAPQRKKLIRA